VISFGFQNLCRTLHSCFISKPTFYATINKCVQAIAGETYCNINKGSGSHLQSEELRVPGDG